MAVAPTDYSGPLTTMEILLHQAVMNNHNDVLKLLLDELPDFPYGKNSAGKSPLYVAVENGNHEIVELILTICKSPSFDGPQEKTTLHAAAMGSSPECMEMMLREINNPYDAMKKMDEFGWTALHYAAKFDKVRHVKLLLSQDKSLGYIAGKNDENSKIPLHIAVICGHLDVVKEMLFHCPDCWEATTGGGEYKNILHLAVENEQKQVLEFILQQIWACELINKKDANGNTPLHLYATASKELEGYNLVNHPCADRDAFNNDDFTPLELIEPDPDKITARQISIKNELVKAGLRNVIRKFDKASERSRTRTRTRSGATPSPRWDVITKLCKTVKSKGVDDESSSSSSFEEKTTLVIATLIITVTFAAGFTVPGGFDNNTQGKEGMAVLSKEKEFIAFVVTNSLAMILSVFVVTEIIFMRDVLEMSRSEMKDVQKITSMSLTLMEIAFSTGLYATLPDKILKICVIVIGSAFAYVALWLFYSYERMTTE